VIGIVTSNEHIFSYAVSIYIYIYINVKLEYSSTPLHRGARTGGVPAVTFDEIIMMSDLYYTNTVS
jgi:hypothetical protein